MKVELQEDKPTTTLENIKTGELFETENGIYIKGSRASSELFKVIRVDDGYIINMYSFAQVHKIEGKFVGKYSNES